MNRILFFTLVCNLCFSIFGVSQTKPISIINAYPPFYKLDWDTSYLSIKIDGFDVLDSCSKRTRFWAILDSNKKVINLNIEQKCSPLFPSSYFFTKKDFNKKFYIRYKVINTCGTGDSIDYLLDFNQQITPKFGCIQSGSTDLWPTTGVVQLPAKSFFVELDASQKPTELRVEKSYSSGFITKGIPEKDSVTIGCVGIVPIRLWAKYPNTSWNYCDTYVDVQNNMGATPKDGGNCVWGYPTGAKVRGSVVTSNGKAIENAIVTISSSNGSSSNKVIGGEFSLVVGVSKSFDLSIKKDDIPTNGISTFDIVLMNRHILGTQLITDKYFLIAADVNNNGKITTSDVVELRKMILGIQKDFSNNQSWRFFNTKKDTSCYGLDLNFIAVKIGDINGNANPLSAFRALNTHTFQAEDAHLKAGETTTLSLKGCEGFGFTMRYDADNLELINLDENSALLENGFITTAQIGSEFKATFRAKSDVTLSKSIFINSDITKAEAVVNDESYDVALEFQAKNTSFELFQNQPNPFHDATKISFILPIESRAKITISDLTGRIMKVIENDFQKGYNELILNDLQASGILQYTLETPTNRATKKMILH